MKERRETRKSQTPSKDKKSELDERIQKLSKEVTGQVKKLLKIKKMEEMLERKISQAGTGKGHKKLDLEKRIFIYVLKSRGLGVREISRRAKVSASTISREFRRNKPLRRIVGLDPYSQAKQANDMALQRRAKGRSSRIRLKTPELQGIVHLNIQCGLTPEFISDRLALEFGLLLSHETIYNWIYDVERELIGYLPRKGKHCRRGGKKRSRAKQQPAAPKTSIDERNEAANLRLEFGHWEVDTVVSKQSKTCLLVLQERVSRFFFVEKIPCCKAEEASEVVIRLLQSVGESVGEDYVKSLTCDNGPENWNHDKITEALKIPVFFCHPYCSQERGGIENRNGVLRRFFPKKTDFQNVPDEELQRVWKLLINRPMRCLEGFTPSEILFGRFEPVLKLAA